MLVDHTFYAILDKLYISGALPLPGLAANGILNHDHWIFGLQFFMRGIVGRIAFPLFCFLLVQGFIHTSDKNKYKLRLFLFALLSEIPFNLAFHDKLVFKTSNVFFTLFLGFAALDVISKSNWHVVFRALAVAALAGIANFLGCDYGEAGVLLIVFFYLARNSRQATIFAGSVAIIAFSVISPMTMLAYIPIAFYNGKKGTGMKWAFYAFYPVHLLILYFIRVSML